MEGEYLDEFYAVREAASDGLRSGAFVGDIGLSLCRFVMLPSFDNAVAGTGASLPEHLGPLSDRRAVERLRRHSLRAGDR